MTAPQQWSYYSLKHIVEQLEPNLRFRLTDRCPSLRNIGKSVPFHINHLELRPHMISVNKITYKLEVVRSRLNDNGVPYDIDNQGHEDRNEVISTSEDELLIDGRFREEQDLNNLLGNFRHLLDALQHMNGNQEDVLDLPAIQENIENYRPPVDKPGQDVLQNFVRQSDYHIRLTRSKPFLQERVLYTKKLYKAMKYLVGRLFGGQQLRVRKLEVCSKTGVLCLPRSLSIYTRNLVLLDENAGPLCEKFRVLLDPKCIPFKTLELNGPVPLEDEVIRSSELLILSDNIDDNSNTEFEKIMELSNQEVWLNFDNAMDHFMRFVECWIEKGMSVGKCYRFSVFCEEEARSLVKEIKDKYWEDAEVIYGSYEYPITFNVLMSYPFAEDEVSIHCTREIFGLWIFSIKVQKPGTIAN